MLYDMNTRRIHILTDRPFTSGPIVYWMSRDMRTTDNWALWYGAKLAQKHQCSFQVVFTLDPSFPHAYERQWDFLFRGLQEIEDRLRSYHIPFSVLLGSPAETILPYLQKHNTHLLITDFSPLRLSRQWKTFIAQQISIPFYEIDSHNIIPPWITSHKQEYAARTIRPKIHTLLSTWLTNIPKTPILTHQNQPTSHTQWNDLWKTCNPSPQVSKVSWLTPGETAAKQALQEFLNHRLEEYEPKRNKPEHNHLSHLSPYLHFGHLSTQRIAWEVSQYPESPSQKSFLEELIVRRELSENFCWYNQHYDSWESFPQWAKDSLNVHRDDPREYLYNLEELTYSQTHDPLWNACQTEMRLTGKMHGYMRMYWAKKILEWTQSPEQALAWTIYLNDTYELDGRDPIGYANIAWSIGGVHDHGWTERAIFGKVRYMSFNSTRRKFKSQEYMDKWNSDHQTLL